MSIKKFAIIVVGVVVVGAVDLIFKTRSTGRKKREQATPSYGQPLKDTFSSSGSKISSDNESSVSSSKPTSE